MLYEIDDLHLKFKKKGNGYNSFELFIPKLCLPDNKVIGIVGESGCGKTTLGKILIGLINNYSYKNYGISQFSGEVKYKDSNFSNNPNILNFNNKVLKAYRNYVQMIFQSPRSALNLNMPLKEIFAEAMPAKLANEYKNERLKYNIDRVGLIDLSNNEGINNKLLKDYLRQRPRNLSGGQRRRVGIVKVVLRRPSVLIADEPIASLDVSVQGKILELLKEIHEFELENNRKHTLIIITHNMRIVRELADTIIVMYNGNVVEYSSREKWNDKIYGHHPYTEHLINASEYLYKGDRNQTFHSTVRSLEEQYSTQNNRCKYYEFCEETSYKKEYCQNYQITDYSFDKGKDLVACIKRNNEK